VRLVAATPLLVIARRHRVPRRRGSARLSRRTRWSRPLHSHNPYMEGLVQRVVQWRGAGRGLLIALDLLGASSLVGAVLGSAGVDGLVLGFAFKDIAENYVAGILLSLRRPSRRRPRADRSRARRQGGRAHLARHAADDARRQPDRLAQRASCSDRWCSTTPRTRSAASISSCRWIPTPPSAYAQRVGLAAVEGIEACSRIPAPYSLVTEYLPDRMTVQFLGWVDQKATTASRARAARDARGEGRAGRLRRAPRRHAAAAGGSTDARAAGKHRARRPHRPTRKSTRNWRRATCERRGKPAGRPERGDAS
jgi:hypothetical protein